MIIHQLKINKQFADETLYGGKKADVRLNDRRFGPGDCIEYQAVENMVPIDHPINRIPFRITHVLGEPYAIPNHVILSVQRA